MIRSLLALTSSHSADPPAEAPPRPEPHVLSAAVDGRTVLLDVRAGRYFALDGAGARIWAHLEEGCGAAEIEERLADEFDAPRPVLAADLTALLVRLRQQGLIR